MEIVITNNPMVRDKISATSRMSIEYYDTDYLGILKIARDRIHLGHSILTHPLSGSLKPGETPYKTLVISSDIGILDEKSLSLIEESIIVCKKFEKIDRSRQSEDILNDFKLIDYDLVFSKL